MQVESETSCQSTAGNETELNVLSKIQSIKQHCVEGVEIQ